MFVGLLPERNVPMVVSDEIGQDLEVDLLTKMTFDGRQSWLFSSPPSRDLTFLDPCFSNKLVSRVTSQRVRIRQAPFCSGNQLVSRALVIAYRPWIRPIWRSESEIRSRSQGKYDLARIASRGAVRRVVERQAENSSFYEMWNPFLHRQWKAHVIRFVSRLGFTAYQVDFYKVISSELAFSLPPFAGLDTFLLPWYMTFI